MKTTTRLFLVLVFLAVSLLGTVLLQRHFVISDWIAQHQRLAEIELTQLNRFARDWQNVVLSLAQHDALRAFRDDTPPSIASREQQILEMTFLELSRAYQPFVKKIRFVHRNGREMVLVTQGRVSRGYANVASDPFLYKVLSASMQQTVLQSMVTNDHNGFIDIAAPVYINGSTIGAIIMSVGVGELTNMMANLQSFGLVSNIFILDPTNRVLSVLAKKDGVTDGIADTVKHIKSLAMTTPIYQLEGNIWVYLQSKDLNVDVLLQISQGDILKRVAERVVIIVILFLSMAMLFYTLGRTAAKYKSITVSPLSPKKIVANFTSTNRLLQSLAQSIRQPLAQWLNSARLLHETQLSLQQSRLLSQIVSNGDWQLQQLDRVIDYADTDNSDWQLEDVEFDLRQLLREWSDFVRVQCDVKGIRCFAMVHAFVPNRIKGDPTRLRQILNIILQRLLDVVSRGDIVIIVKVESQDKKRAVLSLDIVTRQDELFAMARQRVNAILDRQSDDVDPMATLTKRFFQRLIDNFSMDVELPDDGDNKPVMRLVRPWGLGMQPVSASVGVDLKTKRVVLVSENSNNRQAIEQVLLSIGMECHSIDVFENTVPFLQSSQENPFDVCIFDIIKESEAQRVIDVAHQIQSSKSSDETPYLKTLQLVVLTSKLAPGDGASARLAGVGAYLTKPITRTQLTKALAKVLDENRVAESAWVTRHSLIEDQQNHKARIVLMDENYLRRKHLLATILSLGFQVDFVESRDELLTASKNGFYACMILSYEACGKHPLEFVQNLRKVVSSTPDEHAPKVIIAAYADDMEAARTHISADGLDDVLPDPPSEAQLERFLTAYQLQSSNRK